ncbi:MAG: AI-2E family transporter [Oligoflexia bacterium]|nr:AI-2E family transporter [Oligoflexia bacterium]
MIKSSDRSNLVFGIVFFFIIYLLWLMAKPMIGSLLFGAILAGVFYPLKNRIAQKFNLGKIASSSVVTLLMVLLVLVPIIFITISISKEAIGLYQKIVAGLSQAEVNDFLFGDGFVPRTITQISELLSIDIDLALIKQKLLVLLKELSGGLLTKVNSIVGNIAGFIFDLIVMLIVSFGLLVEGDYLKKYMFELSPLPSDQEELLLSTFNQMNYVTLVCNGVGGVIQGVLAGIAFWIVGIDSVVLWTVLMIFLAFIPLVGISIVTVPASIYLMLTGNVVSGVILLIFTSTLALLVENWFKPKFIGDRIQIDSTFVLLSIIGGMGAFGMGGIFYGPIICILFLTIVELYHSNYS